MARERFGQIDFARFDLAGERTMAEDRMTGEPSHDAPNGTATTTTGRGCSAKPDEIDNVSPARQTSGKRDRAMRLRSKGIRSKAG